MKRCWFSLLLMSGCLVSLAAAAAEYSAKSPTSSLAVSSAKHTSVSETIITNEADYAELVRARENQQTTSVKSSSKSSQASSKSSKP